MTSGIAVVGASDRNMWYGNFRTNLRINGWDAEIWPINAGSGTVRGDRAYPDLASVPGSLRAVVVAVATARCPAAVAQAVALGVDDIVCVAAGFSETGSTGSQLQRELIAACGPTTRLYGPNGVGFADYRNSLCLIGQPMPANRPGGNVSIISQSGALLASIMAAVIEDGGGIDWCVSLGNGAQFDIAHAIDHLVDRGTTRSIAVYAETLGNDPARTRSAFEHARKAGVSVVMLKAGKSEVANRIAYTHTASVAGNDAETDAFLRAVGVIRVDSLEELARTAVLAPHVLPSRGRGVAVVGSSGGQAAVAGELAARDGLQLADLTEETMAFVRSVTAPSSFVENPFDLTGMASVNADLFRSVYGDPGVGFVLSPWSITFPDESQGQAHNRPLVELAVETARQTGTPTVVSSLVNVPWTDWILKVRDDNPHVAIVRGIENTIRALSRLFPAVADPTGSDVAHGEPQSGTPTGSLVGEAEGRQLLAHLELPFVKGEVCADVDAALAAADRLGWPVVVKVDVPGVAHKAKMGLVAVGCRDTEDVASGLKHAFTSLERHGRDPRERSAILVQQMAPGREVLVGFHRSELGAFVTIGDGGVEAGAGSTATTLLLPTTKDQLLAALAEVGRLGRTAVGAREAAGAVGRLADEFVDGRLADYDVVEINPAMLSNDACAFVDILLERR